MSDIKTNNSKCLNDKIYSLYNQITKEYDVHALTEDEYNQLSKKEQKEVGYMILVKKNRTKNPDPPSPPAWFNHWCENVFKPAVCGLRNEFKQEIDNVRIELKQEIKNAIHNLAIKNNLKE